MAIPHAIVSAINQRPISSAPPQKCTLVFARACRICFPVQETLKSEAKNKQCPSILQSLLLLVLAATISSVVWL